MQFKEDDEVSKGRSRAVKLAALERDNHECRMCFGKMFLTNHHIIPLSHKNGKDELANSIILCRPCHDRVEVLYSKGVLFPSNCVAYIDFTASERRNQ